MSEGTQKLVSRPLCEGGGRSICSLALRTWRMAGDNLRNQGSFPLFLCWISGKARRILNPAQHSSLPSETVNKEAFKASHQDLRTVLLT